MTGGSSERLPVVVDAMGGDAAPDVVVRGAVQAREQDIPVVLVGDRDVIRAMLPAGSDIDVVHAPEVVPMAAGARTVKRHDGVSVRVAMRLVRDGRGASVVSCGNSGATLVAAVLELGTVPDIGRPAIAATLPRADGGLLILVDAGASTDCRPHHLETFALLGEAYAQVLGMHAPRVGLLSNGHEEGKGSRLVCEAAPLIRAACAHPVGNVEPEEALRGATDVLVADGFTGNIFLKTAEGILEVLQRKLRTELGASMRARLGAQLLRPSIRALRDDFDWRSRGGALLLGVKAPVVVGHGRADAKAVRAAIRLAHYASKGRLADGVAETLAASRRTSGEAATVAAMQERK